MVGSTMQQACAGAKEEAVEVVQNHEDGTREGGGSLSPKEVAGELARRR